MQKRKKLAKKRHNLVIKSHEKSQISVKKTQTREKTDKLIKSDKLVTKRHNLVKMKMTN